MHIPAPQCSADPVRPNLIAGVVALALLGLAVGMGWGSGKGKADVLDKAAGDVVQIDDGYNPFSGRHVLIDVSRLAHKAAKNQAKQVVLEGTSPQQQQYVRRHLDAVVGEGGKPVLVLDGRAYPAKAAERGRRRADRIV